MVPRWCLLPALLVVLLLVGAPVRADGGDDECRDREGEACDTGELGVCAAGRLECKHGNLRCKRIQGPHDEDCTNGLDDDCDGTTDAQDDSCAPAPCPDGDNDGWAVCGGGCVPASGDQCGDCDDRRSDVNPSRAENCGNGRDDDCDGATDGQDSGCVPTACPDLDNDGWAVCSESCAPASGDRCTDCDDGRTDVNPNRAEVCNGRDDDCDGTADEANPGGGAACETGQLGICSAGTLRCSSGSLRCERNLSPRREDCDNALDDDCDGATDLADGECAPDCGPATDADGDHVADCADDCPQLANPDQRDFDGDGMGDACETGVRLCDVNHSGRVDGIDLAALGRAFGRSCGQDAYARNVDFTRDCRVDGDDLALLGSLFGRSP
ncbi:MAG TPA: MopE-related protein [Candidatus Polarisedimenticolaceae bacterium]|nr:MopE-related protein [Candidatus Polarisedimenticolaceae bacterium]